MNRKIFCIGLPRTGTTSLHLALVMHGIPSIHRPIGMAYEMLQGRIPPEFISRYDAFSDLPIPIYHRELKQRFPDALFILTERDEQDWIRSIENFLNSRAQPSEKTILRDMMRLAMFGRMTFERERFLATYHRHTSEVLDSFRNDSESLLRLDASDQNACAKLAGFLGQVTPLKHFPKLNDPNIGRFSAVDRSEIAQVSEHLLNTASPVGQIAESKSTESRQ